MLITIDIVQSVLLWNASAEGKLKWFIDYTNGCELPVATNYTLDERCSSCPCCFLLDSTARFWAAIRLVANWRRFFIGILIEHTSAFESAIASKRSIKSMTNRYHLTRMGRNAEALLVGEKQCQQNQVTGRACVHNGQRDTKHATIAKIASRNSRVVSMSFPLHFTLVNCIWQCVRASLLCTRSSMDTAINKERTPKKYINETNNRSKRSARYSLGRKRKHQTGM